MKISTMKQRVIQHNDITKEKSSMYHNLPDILRTLHCFVLVWFVGTVMLYIQTGTVNAFQGVQFPLKSNNKLFYALSSQVPKQQPQQHQQSLGMISNNEFETEEQKENSKVLDCLILGGGISGSTLAHNLFVSGVQNILLVEARDYLGGNVKSHETTVAVGANNNNNNNNMNDDTTITKTFIWEEGPNSFATQPSIVRISHELNISDQLVFANEALPPWVYHGGKLHPLPKGSGAKGVAGQLELLFGPNGIFNFVFTSELLTWPGKIRAGIGALLGHLPPPTVGTDKDGNTLPKEETIREWVTRTLGEEVFLRCIDPFVSGVYAGNPITLSMKAALPKIARIEDISYNEVSWNKFGALFYGGLKRQIQLTKERKMNPPDPSWKVDFEYGNPGSYRYGLSTLPNAIYKELTQQRIRLSTTVAKVERCDINPMYYKVTLVSTNENNDNPVVVRCKTVVSTLPAHAIGNGIFTNVLPVVDEICSTVRDNIKRVGIYYPPVAAVTVAYPKTSFKSIDLPNGFGNLQSLPGFGSLYPRSENIRTLGTLWSSTLFPGRAPDDYHLLLNYIGGSRDVDVATLSNDALVDEVDKGCRAVLLDDSAPRPLVLGVKLWPTAIPQYELGHLPLIQKLEQYESTTTPGLWICGNYRTGVAFPDCVTFGYEHAKTVIEYLKKQQPQQPQQNNREASTTISSISTSTSTNSNMPVVVEETVPTEINA